MACSTGVFLYCYIHLGCVVRASLMQFYYAIGMGHNYFTSNYVHPTGGWTYYFCFSGVRPPTWFPDILGNSSYPIFTKFGFLTKMAKHKFASISLTVRDRAISSKFSTHRVYKECNVYNFQKISSSQKWRPF